MKKPFVGVIQLLLMVVAVIVMATVFLAFFGIVIWLFDFIWALFVGIIWVRNDRRS